MKRMNVNKQRSAAQFGARGSRTKAANFKGNPMRGGIRL